MRFSRSDLPGLAIAVLAGPLLMVLFLAATETWGHRGTPLLGFMGSNLGIAVGVAAVFSRFILKWDVPLGSLLAIIAVVGAVKWLQVSGNDGTRLATGVKWAGVIAFVVLNLAVLWQLVNNRCAPAARPLRRVASAAGRRALTPAIRPPRQ